MIIAGIGTMPTTQMRMMVIKDAFNPKIIWHRAPKVKNITFERVELDEEHRGLVLHVRESRRKMTRKRFERMLMAMGMRARVAKIISREAARLELPYADTLDYFCKAAVKMREPEGETP